MFGHSIREAGHFKAPLPGIQRACVGNGRVRSPDAPPIQRCVTATTAVAKTFDLGVQYDDGTNFVATEYAKSDSDDNYLVPTKTGA